LRFDRPRHRDYFHLPFDYARINQFPEWFTAEAGKRYRVQRDGEAAQEMDGEKLWRYELALKPDQPVRLTVEPE